MSKIAKNFKTNYRKAKGPNKAYLCFFWNMSQISFLQSTCSVLDSEISKKYYFKQKRLTAR